MRIIDLATFGTPAGALTRIYGSSLQANGEPASGSQGVPVAGGGDLDDDGFHDSAFSAVHGGPLNRAGAGEIIVVFGDGTLGGALPTVGFSPGLLKIAGQHARRRLASRSRSPTSPAMVSAIF